MPETDILNQTATPTWWDIVAIVVGVVGSAITLVSVYATVKSMHQAKRYKEEAEQSCADAYTYKLQAEKQVHSLNLYAYAETVTQLISEIARIPSKENNNKAGKLSSLFDRMIVVTSELIKYITQLEDTEGKKALLDFKTKVTKYLINHRTNTTVDIGELIENFEPIERLLRSEIKVYQDEINKI